ncbi:MAG: sulfite exporter TauE/SafE family protein [Planctomycetes bacterium]|nr:sulfite exporter TauE/SafE family protein [Planctomycetota bacterium]
MDLLPIAITVVTGVAMGAINNVAGGAGVLGLLAFEYAFGLPLSLANPSTRVAAVAVGSFAAIGFLRAGHRIPPRAWLQGLGGLPGALLGSKMAHDLPDLVFRLYLASVLVMLLVQQLRPRPHVAEAKKRPTWVGFLGCFLIGMHMGYVQVGTGLIAALVLAGVYNRDMLAVNAAKSAVVIVTSLTSVTCFVAVDLIQWTPALSLAIGCAIGSYAASHWSVAKGGGAIRHAVVVIAALTLFDQLRHIVLAIA